LRGSVSSRGLQPVALELVLEVEASAPCKSSGMWIVYCSKRDGQRSRTPGLQPADGCAAVRISSDSSGRIQAILRENRLKSPIFAHRLETDAGRVAGRVVRK